MKTIQYKRETQQIHLVRIEHTHLQKKMSTVSVSFLYSWLQMMLCAKGGKAGEEEELVYILDSQVQNWKGIFINLLLFFFQCKSFFFFFFLILIFNLWLIWVDDLEWSWWQMQMQPNASSKKIIDGDGDWSINQRRHNKARMIISVKIHQFDVAVKMESR